MIETPIIEKLQETIAGLEQRLKALATTGPFSDDYAHYINMMPDPVVIYDMVGNAMFVNRQFERIFGWTSFEVVGKTIDFVPDENRAETDDAIGRIRAGEPNVTFPTLRRTRDGRVLEILISASVIQDATGRSSGTVVVLKDISGIQKTEIRLRRSEEKYHSLLETIPHGIQENDLSGVITYSNPAHHRMCGYPEGELIGKRIWDLLADPSEVALLRETLQTLIETQPPPKPYFAKNRTRDARIIDVQVDWDYMRDDDGGLIGFISVITDITDRLRMEQELKKSARRLRNLFEKAGDAIFILEADGDHAGRILETNQAAADMHGYTIEQLRTMTIGQLDAKEDRDRVPERIQRMLSGDWITDEVMHVRSDGSVFPVEVSAGVIADGEERRILAFDRGISERKQAERWMRESEERFRTIIENTAEGILVADASTMRFTYANPAICSYLGHSRQDLAGMSIADIHPPAELPAVIAAFRDLTDGKLDVASSIPCLCRNGSVKYADIRSGRVEIDGRAHTLGFFSDITERKHAEDAYKDQIAFLQTLLEAIPNPIFYKDANGRYLGCNSAYASMMGMTREEIVGKTVFDIAHESLAEVYDRADRSLIATGGIQVYEAAVRFGDGTLHEMVLSKAVFPTQEKALGGLVGVMLDLTETKRLAWERAVLAAAVDQLPEIVLLLDEAGRVQYINAAFSRMAKLPADEATGQSLYELFRVRERGQNLKEIWRSLKSGQPWQGRMAYVNRSGSEIPLEASISPVKQQDDAVANYVVIIRDMTGEIERERQLRQAQKMEAIGTLAGGIAHDFNNILSAIIGYSEMVLQDMPEASVSRRNLGEVLKAGDRAKDLVRQILAFSRQNEQERKPVMVKLVAREALRLLRASLPTTIRIQQELLSESAVLADPTQIHQIVMNLCTNSGHAMRDDGGELTVRLVECSGDEIPGAGDEPLCGNGRFLRLTVADTGCGIPLEIQERIFDPFFTTKNPEEGTGMGLSVVHGIISSYGGRITVESTPGQGTVFDIFLPLIDVEHTIEVVKDAPLAFGTERILLVDDEAFQTDLGKQLLERLGYSVTTRNSSLEALELFARNPNAFDLVITDMTMPDMTGETLGEQMRAIRSNTPIILCTGYSEKITGERARAKGFCGFAMKPLIMKELAMLIRSVLDASN